MQGASDESQDVVSGIVTERVVNEFEVVDIEISEAESPAGPLAPIDFLRDEIVEASRVGQPGQVIRANPFHEERKLCKCGRKDQKESKTNGGIPIPHRGKRRDLSCVDEYPYTNAQHRK